MGAHFLPEADTLQSALQQFSAVTRRGGEEQEGAAIQLRAALALVEQAVITFEGRFSFPVAQRRGYLRLLGLAHEPTVTAFGGHFLAPPAQRWGYLRLLRLVRAASTALGGGVPV